MRTYLPAATRPYFRMRLNIRVSMLPPDRKTAIGGLWDAALQQCRDTGCPGRFDHESSTFGEQQDYPRNLVL